MVSQLYLRLLKTKWQLTAFLLFYVSLCNAQNGISFYAGMGGNQVFSEYASVGDLKNKGTGRVSASFNAGTKLKFSKHLSISLNYLWIKNHITSRFNNVDVTYFNHYSQTGGRVGSLTFVDDLYLYGNCVGVGINYEVPFSKNNLVFSLGLNRALFGSAKNRIDRYYESIPANSTYSNIDLRQSSNLVGTKFWAVNASVRYDRMIHKDQIGVFAQAIFMYNFIDYSFEFSHAPLGWEDRYIYTYGNGSSEVNRYYRLKYHTLNFALGIFYNISFRKHEDH